MPKDKQKVFLMFGVPEGIIDPVDLKWCNEVWVKGTDQQPPKEHFILIDAQKKAITKLINNLNNVSMEVYQEKESTFSSEGKTYDLNYFWKQTANDPVLFIDVNLLKWILDYDNDNSEEDKIRTDNTDLSAPLLITTYNHKELVIDGLHRLKKAVKLNIKKLPYKRVNKNIFEKGEIKSSLESMYTEIPEYVLQSANTDKFLPDIIKRDKGKDRVAIYYQKKIVGFYTPKERRYKDRLYWRTGAIYILPEYRNKGLASTAITDFFKDKEYGLAFIETTNASSLAAFERAGFKRERVDKGRESGLALWVMIKEPTLKPAFLEWK